MTDEAYAAMVRGRMPSIVQRSLFSVLLAIWIVAGARAAEEPAELRVMSFNIRFAREGHSESAPENNWNDPRYPRRDRTIRVIEQFAPDVLGVQEARDPQINDLKASLSKFAFYGVGRDDGKTDGEYAGVFYRSDRFDRKDAGSFWLSDMPDTAGTTFAKNKLPRITSWVKLLDRKAGREFVVLNMHWDHEDRVAREKSAELVSARLSEISQDLPSIVMGDLNSTEDTPAYKTLVGDTGSARQLADCYREIHPTRAADEASFGGWSGRERGSRIDFIFRTRGFTTTAAGIERKSYEGRWPSDHYPVTATLRWR